MNIRRLVLSLILCLSAGGIGSYFTSTAIGDWYNLLEKPVFNPPNSVFGPVWTALYVMMGLAVYFLWQQRPAGGRSKFAAYTWFGVQLILNVAWSGVFFGLQSIFGGLLVLCGLWLAIVMTIREFYKQVPTAAWLLVPYLLWVTFAGVLNYSFWRLNM